MNALARVADARTIRIEDETAKRGIKLRGGVDRCGPCPRCGGTDRFSINVKKQVWNCRGCATGGDVIALVQHVDGVGFQDAIAYLAGAEPSRIVSNILKQPEPIVKQRDEAAERQRSINVWSLVWERAVDPRLTPVEKYLNFRCLDLPAEAAGEAIRFHERCKFRLEYHPAMVCLVRNILTNEPQGVHRTALAADGTAIKRDGKTFRMSLGTIAGGAIKIDPDADVTRGLCIGEGIETCLAGRLIGYRPVWSVITTSGVAGFPLLPGIDGLAIFGERDAKGASERAIRACAERWLAAGKEVLAAWPMGGNDLNDELRRRHVH